MSEIDEHIKKYNDACEKELLLLTKIEDGEWPNPTSGDLWISGLIKWGREFSNREYDIREKG